MGMNGSRLAEKLPEDDSPEEQGSIPSTPILASKIYKDTINKKEYLDPRSPSRHIARTPIELLAKAAEELKAFNTENEDRKFVTATPLKKHVFLGTDPRSPTIDFQRTPIVVSASPENAIPEKICNKNLDKVRKSALLDSPVNSIESKIIPPKLLESSPITTKLEAYKRKSCVGLLETNIDFTETDLDTVIKEKYLAKSLQNLYPSSNSCEIICDPRSPTVDFYRTPIQVSKMTQDIGEDSNRQTEESLLLQPEEEIRVENYEICKLHKEEKVSIPIQKEIKLLDSKKDQKSLIEELQDTEILGLPVPNEVVEEVVLILNNQTDSEESTSSVIQNVSPTNVRNEVVLLPILKHDLPQFAKSAPVTPPNIVAVTPKKSQSQPVTPPVIDLTADVKELEKKLTNLIYEDNDLVVCPRIVKIKEQNRTPLGLRNGTDDRKHVGHKLKVSDKPRRLEYAVSKIPVFKEKKVKVQCENTPPRDMGRIRPKRSQWDAKDDTLVI